MDNILGKLKFKEDDMTEEIKTPKENGEPKSPVQRIVAFEIVADGIKLIRNDCASIVEFQGLLIAAQEFLRKK